MSSTDKYKKYKQLCRQLKSHNIKLKQELLDFKNQCSCVNVSNNNQQFGGQSKEEDDDQDDIKMKQIIKEELDKIDINDDKKGGAHSIAASKGGANDNIIDSKKKDENLAKVSLKKDEHIVEVAKEKNVTKVSLKEDDTKIIPDSNIVKEIESLDTSQRRTVLNEMIDKLDEEKIIEIFNKLIDSESMKGFMFEYFLNPYCYTTNESIIMYTLLYKVAKLKKINLVKYLIRHGTNAENEYVEIIIKDKKIITEVLNEAPKIIHVQNLIDYMKGFECVFDMYIMNFLNKDVAIIDILSQLNEKKKGTLQNAISKIVQIYMDLISKRYSTTIFQNLIDNVIMYIRQYSISYVYLMSLLKIIRKTDKNENIDLMCNYLMELMKLYPIEYSTLNDVEKNNTIDSNKTMGYNSLKLYKTMYEWVEKNITSYDSNILLSNIKKNIIIQKDIYIKFIIK